MLTWLVYDISSDKIRRKIVKMCKRKGLYRVQKSVFLGNIDETKLKSTTAESEELINKKTDSLYIFPYSQDDFKKIKLIGLAFDKAMVNDEIREFFI